MAVVIVKENTEFAQSYMVHARVILGSFKWVLIACKLEISPVIASAS
jgi:hypothetical protein